MPLRIIRNDLLQMEVDAIVNPTDCRLSGSGSIDLKIHYAGKEEFAVLLQLKDIFGWIEKQYAAEYEKNGYFAAICKKTLFGLAMDGKEAGAITL